MISMVKRIASGSEPGVTMSAGNARQKLLSLAIFGAVGGVAFWTLLLLTRVMPTPASTPEVRIPASTPAPQAPNDPTTPEAASPLQAAAQGPQLGLNLSGLADWGTELP